MTLPVHHPSTDTLRDYVLGTLEPAHEVLVATHLSFCPACRESQRDTEEFGGAILSASSEADVDDAFIAQTMARLDAQPQSPPPPRPYDRNRVLPAPVAELAGDLDSLAWRWKVPGVSQVELMNREGGLPLRLVRLRAGITIPAHNHTSNEQAVVLCGGWTDQSSHFGRGDYAFTHREVTHHVQHIDADQDCIALVLNDTPVVPTNPVLRWLVERLRI